MREMIFENLEFLLRIILAGFCGGMIGYERKNRKKEAGVRTHMMVALASALMMVVSKYGFDDVVSDMMRVDPSRVASGIVTGIGFLGAGMIFVRKHMVNGLTTSAGMWATVGVGMAVGAGLYVVGIATTGMIVILQVLLHRKSHGPHPVNAEQILVKLENDSAAVLRIKQVLGEWDVRIGDIRMEKTEDGLLELELSVTMPENLDPFQLVGVMQEDRAVHAFEI